MIMKIHTHTPHESRMFPFWFWGQRSRSWGIDDRRWTITDPVIHLWSWNFIHLFPLSLECALLILGSIDQMSRLLGISDWKLFLDHNWLCNPPMIMKLHTPSPYESRMWLIDCGVKGLGLLGIEISQGCSMFIQRVFVTRLFVSLMHP